VTHGPTSNVSRYSVNGGWNYGERERTLFTLGGVVSGAIHPCGKRSHVHLASSIADHCLSRRAALCASVPEFPPQRPRYDVVRFVRSSTANPPLKGYPRFLEGSVTFRERRATNVRW
jgi:hypothetical protein